MTDEATILTLAVAEPWQRRGIARRLVGAAIELARARGARTVVVATAAADIGNLRFYQRLGFRFRAVERDAFVPATSYPGRIEIDGIVLRDRVIFDLALDPSPA